MSYYELGRRLYVYGRSDGLPSEFRRSPNALPDSFGEPHSLPDTVARLPKVLDDTINLRNGTTSRT